MKILTYIEVVCLAMGGLIFYINTFLNEQLNYTDKTCQKMNTLVLFFKVEMKKGPILGFNINIVSYFIYLYYNNLSAM